MYSQFYKLKKEPFHITPDPEFLFLSGSHKEALAAISYGVQGKKGFVAITGAVGTGKTTILRSYLETARDEKTIIIYIFNPNIPFQGLVKTIYKEMDIESAESDIVDMVNTLHEALIEEYRKGVNVVLVIDEAQNMPVETLENLRMLSNLETSTDKLIQIVLVGQPELEGILGRHELRQLKQRIAIRARILPLNEDESFAYIKHRLGKVALNNGTVFTRGALKKIVDHADGIPRVINILCDNALITGYGYQENPVTERVVREVIGDMAGKTKRPLLKWGFAVISLVILIAGFFGVFHQRIQSFFLSKEHAVPVRQIKQNVKETKAPPVTTAHLGATDMKQTPEVPAVKKEPETPAIAGHTVKKDVQAATSPPKEPAEKKGPSKRIARQGDTLTALILETYGRLDKGILTFVRQHNPHIKDSNLIIVGSEILFPELPPNKGTGRN